MLSKRICTNVRTWNRAHPIPISPELDCKETRKSRHTGSISVFLDSLHFL